MSSVRRQLATFALVLVGLYAAGYAAGHVIDADTSAGHGESGHAREDLRVRVIAADLAAGRPGQLALRVLDAGGEVVRDFEVEHTKRLHLILVRRDLTGFQHLHPEMAADGTWSLPVRFAQGGTYRVFADVKVDGEKHVLSEDVSVAGDSQAEPLPAPSDVATTDDGYEVTLARDGAETAFTVRKDGRPVTDIEPYLGARGHLVALREGDLEYLHVHPTSAATAGRDIRFEVEYPSAARYRLFLQFRHADRVHTAAFTQGVEEDGDEHGH